MKLDELKSALERAHAEVNPKGTMAALRMAQDQVATLSAELRAAQERIGMLEAALKWTEQKP